MYVVEVISQKKQNKTEHEILSTFCFAVRAIYLQINHKSICLVIVESFREICDKFLKQTIEFHVALYVSLVFPFMVVTTLTISLNYCRRSYL